MLHYRRLLFFAQTLDLILVRIGSKMFTELLERIPHDLSFFDPVDITMRAIRPHDLLRFESHLVDLINVQVRQTVDASE